MISACEPSWPARKIRHRKSTDAFGPDGLMAYIETDEMDVPGVRVTRLVSLER